MDVVENDFRYWNEMKNCGNGRNHQTWVVVENICFLDLLELNDESAVVIQRLVAADQIMEMEWILVWKKDKIDRMVVEIEKQAEIGNGMDVEIDDDWNFQMYAWADIDENVLVLVEMMVEDHWASVDEYNK